MSKLLIEQTNKVFILVAPSIFLLEGNVEMYFTQENRLFSYYFVRRPPNDEHGKGVKLEHSFVHKTS